MGNLGMYQFITTVSKRVGGPRNFIIIVAATGYGLGKAVEFGVKFIKNKAGRNNVKNECKDITREYDVKKERESKNGVKFIKGDKVRVLAIDKDAILIQRNDSDNEIDYVSFGFLKDITGETITE